MATLVAAHWEPSFDAPTRSAQRGGRYFPYLPDPLTSRALLIPAGLARRAYEMESAVRQLAASPRAHGLEGLARFLLRSEAIASSKIEGLRVSPQQLALAELAQEDASVTKGFTANARLVANNITALRQASTDLAAASTVSIAGIDALHQALLPDERHHGLRTTQNWIGGSDWRPIGADYVPPPPDRVAELMADLCDYLNGAAHAPLVQGAMVHAQFETIHPYPDGNGRVGRALIHTVLVRRGLTPAALLPISLVLLTRSQTYLDGLTAYRYGDAPDSNAAQRAGAAWLEIFLDAVEVAVEQAIQFGKEVAELGDAWQVRLADYRTRRGVRSRPRARSATSRILALLPELPVLTGRTTQHRLGVSFQSARTALEQLAEAKIVHRKQVDRGTTCYLAREIFDLLTFAERRLASTQWDTRESTPVRPVPGRPVSRRLHNA